MKKEGERKMNNKWKELMQIGFNFLGLISFMWMWFIFIDLIENSTMKWITTFFWFVIEMTIMLSANKLLDAWSNKDDK